MTPTQFKDARKALDLSINDMAEALGLTGRAIRQFESDEGTKSHRAVSGPVAKLVEMLLEQDRKRMEKVK